MHAASAHDNAMINSDNVSIIALAPNEWEGQWMNRQQLLSRLATKGWSILYSTGCISWWDRGGERWRKASYSSRHKFLDGVLVDKPGRDLLRWPKFRFYDNWILRKHSSRLRSLAGWNKKDTIKVAFIFHPIFFPYLEFLNPDYVVYHIYDFHAGVPGWDRQKAVWEQKIIENCDLLTVITRSVADNLSDPGSSKAKILGNGVDIDIFTPSNLDEPDDLKTIPKPRIGYTGTINIKLDWELVDCISEILPDLHWVLVGPVKMDNISDHKVALAWKRCQKKRNIHFLGPKARADIPMYVNHMNIGGLFYRMQGKKGWWLFGYPLKLHEYLACGKPVICSPLPAVTPFSGVIEIPSSPEEWIRSIERCLESEKNGEEKALRVKVAMENSWDKRSDELEQYLLSGIQQRVINDEKNNKE